MNWYLKVLNKYSDFNGRASKSEFWTFTFYNFIFIILSIILDNLFEITIDDLGFGPIYILYFLTLLTPNLAVNVRRLHDVGKSGWLFLISLIPIIGTIWLIIQLISDGELGENEYGINPENIIKENSLSIEDKENDFEKAFLLISRKRELLQETFESGLITQNELDSKLELIKSEELLLESKLKENEFNSIIEEEITINKEKLLELKEQGLLTEKEYNDKVDSLYEKQVKINENERLELEKQLEREKGYELSETTEYLLIGGAILIILLFAAFKYFTSEF